MKIWENKPVIWSWSWCSRNYFVEPKYRLCMICSFNQNMFQPLLFISNRLTPLRITGRIQYCLATVYVIVTGTDRILCGQVKFLRRKSIYICFCWIFFFIYKSINIGSESKSEPNEAIKWSRTPEPNFGSATLLIKRKN